MMQVQMIRFGLYLGACRAGGERAPLPQALKFLLPAKVRTLIYK